jgi:hypothetical protein
VSSFAGTAANTIPGGSARAAVTIGKSTKAEVLAALGKAAVIRFDSGFEVWVYQITGEPVTIQTAAKASAEAPGGRDSLEVATRGKAEFVILFAPSGVVSKTRVRPSPLPGKARAE